MNIKEKSILQKIQTVTDYISKSEKTENNLEDLIEEYTETLHDIAQFLNCTNVEALLFCTIFYLTISRGDTCNRSISEFLNCGPYDVLRMTTELSGLTKKKLLVRRVSRSKYEMDTFLVPENVILSITKNTLPLPEKNPENLFELADILAKKFDQLDSNELILSDFLIELGYLELVCKDFPIYVLMNELKISNHEKVVFLYIVLQTIQGAQASDLYAIIENLFGALNNVFVIKRLFSFKRTKLLKENYLEFTESVFRNERCVRLSNKSLNRIFEDDVKLLPVPGNAKENFTRTLCKDIEPKELFYNEEELKSVLTVENCILEERYNTVVKELQNKKMPGGIITLLHGYPGTGKTETVYQLARKSCRDVIKVDISSIRDKYVGESEKKLKAIFDDYRRVCEKTKKVPILLFNESDSLISKRMSIGHSVDQMNNVMQNILLEELENFNGILFATTNLTVNLDRAFERRFLFKIRFKKPTEEAKAKIWQSKIEGLQLDDAYFLAKNFNLSGGEIDNIARKIIIDSILGKSTVDIDRITEYCSNEKIEKEKTNQIGFLRNNN